MGPILFCILFIALVPITLYLIFKPIMEDRNLRNNVNNSDAFSRHYCYALNCTQQEAIKQLSLRNIHDALDCSLDENANTVKLMHLNASIEYQLLFYTVENRTYLKVRRAHLLHERSNIPYLVNRFFIEKLDAQPMDHAAFEALINTVNSANATK